MTRLPFVDAHLHLWDRSRLRYPWLDKPENASIAETYTIADYASEAAAWNVAGAIHVDAGAHPADGLTETDWVNAVADTAEWPIGIVARVALNDPDVAALLEKQASRARVKGIRHLVNWHPHDAARRAYSRDLTADDAWQRGYAMLGRYGLSFDFHGFPAQLAGFAAVAQRHPEVPVILDHLALPIRADGLAEWRAGLIAFAGMPHAAIKLSGAGFVHAPFDPNIFGPILHEVIDRFGTGRVMIATNFPTDRLFASMDTTLAAYESLMAAMSADERRDLWGRNANRIYRLKAKL